MKKLLITTLLACVTPLLASAQGTDIVEVKLSADVMASVESPIKRITNRAGYDSQPLYLSDSSFYYTSMRDGITQIVRYDRETDKHTQLTHNRLNEYSPTPRSDGGFSAVQGAKQHLVGYDADAKSSAPVTRQTMVGYHAWQTIDGKERLWMAVVEGSAEAPVMNLYLQEGEKISRILDNVGRSLKPRGNELIIIQDRSVSLIGSDLKTTKLAPLPEATTDISVDSSGSIWAGSGVKLMKLEGANWRVIRDFTQFAKVNKLSSISRIDITPSLSHAVLVFDRQAP